MEKEVALSHIEEYDVSVIRQELAEQLKELGVLDRLKSGMRVAVKLNLVSAMKPETAATTHPAVVEALCIILKNLGCEVILGDSPGAPFTASYLKGVYKTCGITDVAERTGARLNDDFSQRDVTFPDGVIARNITFTSWLLDADCIINCAKLKTHGMMGMTAAVKNMFGAIPGTMKPEYHFRFPKQTDFADMLIDIQQYFAPRMLVHITDAIIGMEGNGPTAGMPRRIGLLMASTDPYSLDLISGRVIGLERKDMLIHSRAYERKLCPDSADSVKLFMDGRLQTEENTSDLLKPFLITDYKLLDNKADLQFGGNSMIQRLRGMAASSVFAAKPCVNREECIGCEKCFSICPAGAITMKNSVPEIDRSKCIKCFCCQEFCPRGAMKVKRKALARLLTH